MVLVDTSVWVEHLRRSHADLAKLLGEERGLCHPFVVGELACGNLANRQGVLGLLGELPQCKQADHDEVLNWLEFAGLMGRGVGWVDVHLLASARLSHARLWTLDRRLAKVAADLKVGFPGA